MSRVADGLIVEEEFMGGRRGNGIWRFRRWRGGRMFERMSNEELWLSTKDVFSRERVACIESIRHLREIESRKLNLERGYGGLLEPCMEEFRLSQTASFQRIACLRVVQELPEAERMLESGELTMSVVAMVRRFFRREDDRGAHWSYNKKVGLLETLKGLSCREAQKVLVSHNDEFTDPDGVDYVSEKMVRLRMHMKVSDHKAIEKLRQLYSHTHPGMTDCELFLKLVKAELDKRTVMRRGEDDAEPLPTSESRITAAVKREVWKKAHLGCAFISPRTGRRCGSLHMLEIDHILERAAGGTNDLKNLQLCCDKHNRFKSETRFGKFTKKRKSPGR